MTVTVTVLSSFSVFSTAPDGTRTPIDRDALELECDKLMDALLALEETDCGISDTSIAADFALATVEISVTAVGNEFDEAEATAESSVRAAIHTVGGATPTWSSFFDARAKHSELVPA